MSLGAHLPVIEGLSDNFSVGIAVLDLAFGSLKKQIK
jgi:hypothetical protein